VTADDLSSLSAADIDALPFGFIALGHDGTVRRYNRYEADLSRRDPREVLGRNFFREVAPCTAVKDFEGRFVELVSGSGVDTATFDFEFKFGHGHQQVRIGMTRSPLVPEVIVTVNRLRDLGLPKSAVLSPDIVHGLVRDDAGRALVLADIDFWNALEDGLSGSTPEERATLLHAIGASWGRRHAERLDALIQDSHRRTLREAELQVALEAVSGSLGLLGLGRCEVELGFRQRGLVVVFHQHDPIAMALAPRGSFEAALLAGFFAGVVGHLAGRTLTGWALHSAGTHSDHNVFAIGVASRIAALRSPTPSAGDRQLLDQLALRVKVSR
jgi:photoactive yellow protein